MDLQYVSRTDRDEEGKYYGIHFLCDMQSGRAFGYVEEPSLGSDQFMFVATPYDGQTRCYLALDKAKQYLERVAIKEEAKDSEELSTIGVRSEKEVETPKE